MSELLKVRGLDAFKYKFLKFAALFLYFPGKNDVRSLVYILL